MVSFVVDDDTDIRAGSDLVHESAILVAGMAERD